MHICFSTAFFPTLGGVTEFSRAVATEWVNMGHRVTLIVENDCERDSFPAFEIVCKSSSKQLLNAIKRCDLFVENNVGFRANWPLFVYWRPRVIIHHGYYYVRAQHTDRKSVV